MSRVLVDSSVWIDYFDEGNPELSSLLDADLILSHPMVIGELACGILPDRAFTLHEIWQLKQVRLVSVSEVVVFIERERLYAQGCGLVDLSLLAATLMTPGAKLWTLDKKLSGLAERFGVMHQRVLH